MWSCQKDTNTQRLCFHTELQTRLVSFRERWCGYCSQSRHFLGNECVVAWKMGVCLDTQLVSGLIPVFPHGCSARFSKLLLKCPYSLRSPVISTLQHAVWPFRVKDVLVKLKGSWKGMDLCLKEVELCSVHWWCKTCCIMLWGISLICWNIGTWTKCCLSSASKVKASN